MINQNFFTVSEIVNLCRALEFQADYCGWDDDSLNLRNLLLSLIKDKGLDKEISFSRHL